MSITATLTATVTKLPLDGGQVGTLSLTDHQGLPAGSIQFKIDGMKNTIESRSGNFTVGTTFMLDFSLGTSQDSQATWTGDALSVQLTKRSTRAVYFQIPVWGTQPSFFETHNPVPFATKYVYFQLAESQTSEQAEQTTEMATS